MATIFTHGIVAIAIGSVFPPSVLPRGLWVAGALCAILPDADVLGLACGVPYDSFWGHRGFTHALLFAALLAPLLTWGVLFRRPYKPAVCAYLFLATASHGVLDALTDGGLGIAFFSPFDDQRYFLPWTLLPVSPIGAGFFSAAGATVLQWEVLLVWLPALVAITLSQWYWSTRHWSKRRWSHTPEKSP